MTDKIDWDNAPNGATHYNHESKQFFAQVCEKIMTYHNGTWTRIEGYTIADIESAAATVKRPESITDVARSIEAARVEERDAVNNPKHYTSHASGIECIQITEHMGFNLGNAVKYIWRCDLKHDAPIQDLEKAIWYIEREIKRRGGAA